MRRKKCSVTLRVTGAEIPYFMEAHTFPLSEEAQRELDHLRRGLPRNRVHRTLQGGSASKGGLALGVLVAIGAMLLLRR